MSQLSNTGSLRLPRKTGGGVMINFNDDRLYINRKEFGDCIGDKIEN